jgi:hypothetical protein
MQAPRMPLQLWVPRAFLPCLPGPRWSTTGCQPSGAEKSSPSMATLQTSSLLRGEFLGGGFQPLALVLGSPRPLSAMIERWISLVPA